MNGINISGGGNKVAQETLRMIASANGELATAIGKLADANRATVEATEKVSSGPHNITVSGCHIEMGSTPGTGIRFGSVPDEEISENENTEEENSRDDEVDGKSNEEYPEIIDIGKVNMGVVKAYGFQLCAKCGVKQGVFRGPTGSYALFCYECLEGVEGDQ